MASCYHPDGFDDHNSFRGSGTEFAKWVCEVLPHFEATHALRRRPPTSASTATSPRSTPTAWPTTSAADNDMVLGLRYVDRFERRDGAWLIAKRVCAFDWTYTVPFDPRSPLHASRPTSPSATATAATSPTPACSRAAGARPQPIGSGRSADRVAVAHRAVRDVVDLDPAPGVGRVHHRARHTEVHHHVTRVLEQVAGDGGLGGSRRRGGDLRAAAAAGSRRRPRPTRTT